MTSSTRIAIAGLLLLLVTTACSKPAQNSAGASTNAAAAYPPARITSESVVKVKAQPVEIPAGGSAEAVVQMSIQHGYHVNANPPTYPYLKATTLEIPPRDGVSVSFVIYPKALERKFAFAENPLAVYEGETELKVTLKADKAAHAGERSIPDRARIQAGERSIPARLRIQACDEQVCYPPGTLEFVIPVNIK